MVNPDVDLERESRMFILWNKPPIRVSFIERIYDDGIREKKDVLD